MLTEPDPELLDNGDSLDQHVRSPQEQDLTASFTYEPKAKGIEDGVHSSNPVETYADETESISGSSEISIESVEALRRQLLLPKLFSKRCVDPPDARSMLKQEPPVELLVTSPRGPPSCVGIYELTSGRKANGFPCWRHVDGSHWLFSSTRGKWIIGGPDLKFDEFWRDNGILSQCVLHGGRLPHIQGVAWQRWTGARIAEDRAISVVVHKAAVFPTEVSLTLAGGCDDTEEDESHTVEPAADRWVPQRFE